MIFLSKSFPDGIVLKNVEFHHSSAEFATEDLSFCDLLQLRLSSLSAFIQSYLAKDHKRRISSFTAECELRIDFRLHFLKD